MITIPLALVADLLRHHDAFAALEGAPYLWTGAGLPTPMQGLPASGRVMVGAQELGFLEDGRRPLLYLGSGDICPAALGWAARVLALARGLDIAHPWLSAPSPNEVRLYRPGGDRCAAFWWWTGYDAISETFRRSHGFPGPAPTTPAERLRAVLLHELHPLAAGSTDQKGDSRSEEATPAASVTPGVSDGD